MTVEAELVTRVDSLMETGRTLLARRRNQGEHGPEHWVDEQHITEVQAWIASVANLISHIALPGTYFRDEADRITSSDELRGGAPWTLIQKLQGLLVSLKDEASHGLLRKFEYVIVATAFDNFLDHAADFHKGNKAREAGVLAAVVLEDTIKRIATKNNVATEGKSLEQLIDEFVKVGIFTQVKAKRVKAYAGVRNPALHAEWEKFDIRDAGELIAGVRELIENFL